MQNVTWHGSQRVKKQCLIVVAPHLHNENNAILRSANTPAVVENSKQIIGLEGMLELKWKLDQFSFRKPPAQRL